MTQRAIALADLVVAELNAKTFTVGATDFELAGASAPTRQSHIVRNVVESGGQTRPVVVSVVPRGKDKSRGARGVFGEEMTIAVVVQRKLDPASDRTAQVDELAALVELLDDHLAEVAPTLGDYAFHESTTNPFWNVDDLLTRNQFTGIVEAVYLGDREIDDDE